MAAVTKIVIVGSGSSSSTPKLGCVVRAAAAATAATSASPGSDGVPKACRVCADALADPDSRNHRLNPMLLVEADNGARILVDCGKTFRESMLKMVRRGVDVSFFSALLVTHSHADATGGCDDLREFTPDEHSITAFADAATTARLRGAFPYLFGGATSWVASITWAQFEQGAEIDVCGVPVRSIPVPHGPGYLSNAFAFRVAGGGSVVYVSDVSELPDDALAAVRAHEPIRVLVLDMLAVRENPTHLTKAQALECARRVGAERTVFVGMSHSMDYYALEDELRGLGARADTATYFMGFDGMCVWDGGAPALDVS